MLTKEVIIELFKKQIDANIQHNGVLTVKLLNEYVVLFGFFFEFKSTRCHIGITGSENAATLDIYFNSIVERLSHEEYVSLLNVFKDSLRNKDFNLLETLASQSDVDISRRVLTEKRTGKEKIKF